MEDESPHRFVVDTNTIVSAILYPLSVPGKAFEFAALRGRLLISVEMAAELTVVMRREKFDRYVRLSLREELVAGIIRMSELVETTTTVAGCRDPADNRLLELATNGNAAAIISGDTDLLALNPYHGIPILTPRDFLSHFAST